MKIRNFLALVDVKAKMSLKSDASKLYLSYLWWVLEPVGTDALSGVYGTAGLCAGYPVFDDRKDSVHVVQQVGALVLKQYCWW